MTAASVPDRSRWRRVANLTDYWMTVYRRTWRGSVINSFVTPLLYVLAMGVLLGSYVKASPSTLGGAGSYLEFVVPGLLAAQTMTMAAGESTYPVMGALKWHKTFESMVATPLGVPEVFLANLAFIVARVLVAAAVFVVVMTPFGVLHSVPGAIGLVLLQGLVACAFAAPIYAYAAWVRSEEGFTVIFRLLIMPLFLFSGGFFPISNLPDVLQVVARATPLWHATELSRALSLGSVEIGPALVHVAYLAILALVGGRLSLITLSRRLVH